jgi:hypothetical protein
MSVAGADEQRHVHGAQRVARASAACPPMPNRDAGALEESPRVLFHSRIIRAF